jgi:hypothetical protein
VSSVPPRPEDAEPAAQPSAPEAEPGTPAPAEDAAIRPTDAAPGPPVEPAAAIPVPGFGTGLARSLDLSVQATPQLRSASIYVGLLFLGVIGPVVLLVIAIVGRHPIVADVIGTLLTGGQPLPVDPEAREAVLTLLPVSTIALLGLVAVSVDAQAIAILLLAGRLIGEPVPLRASIAWARTRFWALLRGILLIGIAATILSAVLSEQLAPVLGRDSEGTILAASTLSTLAVLPFVYVATGIVLGEVGAIEAARRSIRLTRARWGLAILISVIGIGIGYIQAFALGSGADVLARIGIALNLGFDRGTPSAVATVVLTLAAIIALGSLTFTVAALAAAPQVLGFVSLTGYLGGLRRAGRERPPQVPWISMPMTVGIGFAVLIALLGVANVVS